jgi:hypothetical protein
MEPGVYFGLDESAYHAVEAMSSSGVKLMKAHPMEYWARSAMNPLREDVSSDEETFAKLCGSAYHARIVEGREEFYDRYAPTLTIDDCPKGTLRTVEDIRAVLREHDGAKLGGNKPELIARLLECDPCAKIFDVMLATYEDEHDGKTFLPAKVIAKIEVAAAMIEKHPVLSKAFSGGVPEVSVFWTDEATGIPCKSRMDYLKPKAIVDLKSFSNPHLKPVERAINAAFANGRYHIPAAMYLNAGSVAAEHIRKGRVFGDCDPALLKALGQDHEKTFLFIFQATGAAPIARGKTLPANTGLCQIGQLEIRHALEAMRANLDRYGRDFWVDDAPITAFDDSEVPAYATE